MNVQHLQTIRTVRNSGHISVFATLLNLQPRPARSDQTENPEKNATHHSETLPHYNKQNTNGAMESYTHIKQPPAKPLIGFQTHITQK
jgi:hypothetical protein